MSFLRGKFEVLHDRPKLMLYYRWDLLGQQVVGQLADCATTALNAVIPALVDNLNPIAKAKAAASMAGNLIHGDETKAPNDTPAVDGNASAPAVSKPANSPVSTRPKDADDPAYSQVARDLPFYELINGIFKGDDGGVDWDKAKGEPGKANQSIAFAAKMLQLSKTSFASQATSSEPSKTYSQALASASGVNLDRLRDLPNGLNMLTSTLQVADGIKAELAKAKDINYTLPATDSTTVKTWQNDFTLAYGKVVGMNSTAKSLPGAPAGGVCSIPHVP